MRLDRGQRKLRQARLLLVAVAEEHPELRDETQAAIAATVRAEDRSAELLREAIGIKRR